MDGGLGPVMTELARWKEMGNQPVQQALRPRLDPSDCHGTPYSYATRSPAFQSIAPTSEINVRDTSLVPICGR